MYLIAHPPPPKKKKNSQVISLYHAPKHKSGTKL